MSELALRVAPAPGLYAPKAQRPWMQHETRDLVIRTNADTAALAPALQAVLRELERDMPLAPLQRMDDVDVALARPGFYASAVASLLSRRCWRRSAFTGPSRQLWPCAVASSVFAWRSVRPVETS